ncbi:hypothetical protein APHAL10511_000893 [Amanita phalloides]|nr:hypothetical protein APHAL10511_000893 [Amanita phalloides]
MEFPLLPCRDEAHTASVKLQHHSFDAAHNRNHVTHLERENEVLRKEIAVLRAHPHPDASPDAHPAVSQVRQLTLSLRQLSDKLSHTEEALLARTTDLARALSKAKKARRSADDLHELAARMRQRQEEEMVIERELRLKLEMAEEEKRMSDLVVKEYADLVRSLERRLHAQSTLAEDDTFIPTARRSPTPSLAESLEKGKLGLQRLVAEFSEESERLRREISQLQNDLAESRTRAEAQKKIAEQHRLELAKVQTELQKLNIDDNTAAKMVSRYMKFSQASTDALQTALSTLKARHAATLDTLSTQISHVTRQLQDTETTCERLRDALEDLGGDYMKESYGRRREVTLRIKLINREEKLMESLRRWILRAQEAFNRVEDVSAQESLAKIVNEATTILLSNDGPLSQPPSASLARIIAVQTAAESLTNELHVESRRRLELQMALTIGRQDQPGVDIDYRKSAYRENSTQYEALLLSSVAIQTSDLREPLPISPLMIGSPSIDPGMSLDVRKSHSEPFFNTNILGVSRDASLEGTLRMNTDEKTGSENHDTATLTIATTIAQTRPSELVESPFTSLMQGHVVLASTDEEQFNDVNRAESPIDTYFDATVTQGQGAVAVAVPEVVVEQASDMPQSLLLSAPHEKCDISAILVPDICSAPEIGDTESLSPQYQSEQPVDLPSSEQQKHPLVTELHKVNHRYNDLQRDFHDCYFALDSLKQSLAASSSDHQIPSGALRLALERLTDYIEDARVELEIRIADESLLAHGYETLLSVPGALASPGPRDQSGEMASQVEQQIEAFVSGTEPGIQKAQESLTRKLSDVQHDIVILKRTIHGLEEEASPVPSEEFRLSSSLLLGSVPATAPLPGTRAGGWTSWIRASSSRPSSPAPTFGSVMTSPHFRYHDVGRTGKSYTFTGDAGSKDPLASLGLRVPMPTYVPPQVPVHPIARSRTVSTMYMLGLGARTASGSLTSLLSPHRIVDPRPELTDDDVE